MTDQPNYTGICPPGLFSTGDTRWISPEASPTSASKRELIELWFIDPLRRMDGDQAFICLSVCLFLYEKYLRKTDQIGKDEKFSKGHKVFIQIGKDLGICSEDAYEFWSCWRNGLAHQGMPKNSDKYHWGMTGNQAELVLIDGVTFTINPWHIRDKILNKVEKKKEIWNDELAPLMKRFVLTKP